jgi:hypothetical protein
MAVQRLIRAWNKSHSWVWVLCIATAMSHTAYCADARTFTSEMFGYRLAVPVGWHVAVPPSGVPVFFNYDVSQALPQGLIPGGGANIYLIPYEAVSRVTRARDLQDWIQANSAEWHTNVRTSRVAGSPSDGTMPQEIVKVEADFERAPEDEARQTEINYYFVLRGSGFRLRMLYGKGDPRSSYFRAVIEILLRSIKTL